MTFKVLNNALSLSVTFSLFYFRISTLCFLLSLLSLSLCFIAIVKLEWHFSNYGIILATKNAQLNQNTQKKKNFMLNSGQTLKIQFFTERKKIVCSLNIKKCNQIKHIWSFDKKKSCQMTSLKSIKWHTSLLKYIVLKLTSG